LYTLFGQEVEDLDGFEAMKVGFKEWWEGYPAMTGRGVAAWSHDYENALPVPKGVGGTLSILD
jgi:hypothetical protein